MEYTIANAERRAHEEASILAEIERQESVRRSLFPPLPPVPALSTSSTLAFRPANETLRLQQLLADTLRRHPTRAAEIERFLLQMDEDTPMVG